MLPLFKCSDGGSGMSQNVVHTSMLVLRSLLICLLLLLLKVLCCLRSLHACSQFCCAFVQARAQVTERDIAAVSVIAAASNAVAADTPKTNCTAATTIAANIVNAIAATTAASCATTRAAAAYAHTADAVTSDNATARVHSSQHALQACNEVGTSSITCLQRRLCDRLEVWLRCQRALMSPQLALQLVTLALRREHRLQGDLRRTQQCSDC